MSNQQRILVSMTEPEDLGPADRERELVERFREVRLSLGMSQEELSRRLIDAGLKSMNQMAVSRLEAGKRSLRFHEAVVIAEALGQSLSRLMESNGDRDVYFIQQTALEAQIESNQVQLAEMVVDTLRKQAQLIDIMSKMAWSTEDVSYLMAGSLLPIAAITRDASSRYFQGEFGKLAHEFLSQPENQIQNETLEQYRQASTRDDDHRLLSEYLRRINGFGQEEG